MVSSSQTAIQRDLLRIRWKEEAFRGSISDIVTPLVELPSVLCDVVEILEGAVRVVTGQGGHRSGWSVPVVRGQGGGRGQWSSSDEGNTALCCHQHCS